MDVLYDAFFVKKYSVSFLHFVQKSFLFFSAIFFFSLSILFSEKNKRELSPFDIPHS